MNSEGLLTLGTHESGMIQPVVLGEEEMEEPTSPGTGGDKKKRRRNRKPVTCQQCRKRKLKCDRGAPCGACKDRNEGDACEWEGAIRLPQSNYSRDQEAVELRAQLDRLEGLLGMLGATSDDIGGIPSGSRSEKLDVHRGSFERERIIAAEALGLLAGPGSPQQLNRPSVFPSAPSASPSFSQLVSMLPQPQELDMMVADFLNPSVTSFLPLIHAPSFLDRYRLFAHYRLTGGLGDHLHLIAFLLAISGWETYRSTRDPRTNRVTLAGRQATARAYIQASMDSLHLAGFTESHCFDDVRTLLLMHRYYTHIDSSSANVVLNLGIQIAQGLGLNQDVAPYSQFNFVEAEERRRLWTILVSSDWLDNSCRIYTCSPLQSDALLPSNAHDHDITPTSILPLSLHTPTPLHCLIFRSRLSVLARTITDRAFSLQVPPSWNTILELNAELSRVAEELPECFAFEWEEGAIRCWSREREGREGEAVREEEETRVEIHLVLRGMFIRLHRPFLTRGFSDPRFAFSREKCCWAARYTLAIHRGLGTDYRAMQNWSLTFHTLNALLILSLDLYQDPAGPYSVIHRTDIAISLHLLQSNPFPSPMMTEALIAITTLLSRTESPIAANGDNLNNGGEASANGASSHETLVSPLTTNGNGNGSINGSNPQALLRPFDPAMPLRIPLPIPMTCDPLAPFPLLSPVIQQPLSMGSTSTSNGGTRTGSKRLKTGNATNGAETNELQVEDDEMLHLWSGLRSYKRMYAVPDWEEWEELRLGRGWRNNGIDLV